MKKNNTITKVLLLLCLTMIGLVIATMALMIIGVAMSTDKIVTASVIQDVFLFIMPALVMGAVSDGNPFKYSKLHRAPTWKAVAVILTVYVIAIPAMNWVVWLNEQLSLPDSLQALEHWMRVQEDSAQAVTAQMLASSTLSQMLLMVLVVGVVAAFSEELYFRGAMMRICLDAKMNTHVAVWLLAVIFSALHMQFFGFIPRLLLGAWLGYLLIWTRSLWAPIIAHALNNGMVVVMTYLETKQITDGNLLDSPGTPVSGEVPLIAVVSLVVTVVAVVVSSKLLNGARLSRQHENSAFAQQKEHV